MRKLVLLCLFAASGLWAADTFVNWSGYLGGPESQQYTPLKQITKTTVKQLEVAWTYPTGMGTFTFNPVVVDGVMYVVGKNNSTIVALDAATGKELWSHANTAPGRSGAVGPAGPTPRGFNYWESKDKSDKRLLFVAGGSYLTALNAKTGEVIKSFGDNGLTDVKTGLDDRNVANVRISVSNPGKIYDNLIILSLMPANVGDSYSATPGDIHAFDVRTGKLAWVFHSVPRPGEFGYDTWPPDAWKTQGGVHNWNEATVDEKRGIVFIPFGTARYDFYGANRKGNDLFGNSLVALDARTGKRLWSFQMVHHDLWDYDLPTAPKLLTVKHDGKNVDVVAQPTKFGFLYVFNRVTGEPLWPIEERPVPQSDVPGEFSSPTQPFPTKPPAFARQSFTEKDINPYLSDEDKAKVRTVLQTYRNEGLFTPPSLRGTVEMPGNNGGANWGSSGVNPSKGMIYIVSKELPMTIKLGLPGARTWRRRPGRTRRSQGRRCSRCACSSTAACARRQIHPLQRALRFHAAIERPVGDRASMVAVNRRRSEYGHDQVAGSRRHRSFGRRASQRCHGQLLPARRRAGDRGRAGIRGDVVGPQAARLRRGHRQGGLGDQSSGGLRRACPRRTKWADGSTSRFAWRAETG